MPVWIGCEDNLVNALQVTVNKDARLVTKLDIFIPHAAVWLDASEAPHGLPQPCAPS
jgi:hypothetical protein